jgi:hypothetical protein
MDDASLTPDLRVADLLCYCRGNDPQYAPSLIAMSLQSLFLFRYPNGCLPLPPLIRQPENHIVDLSATRGRKLVTMQQEPMPGSFHISCVGHCLVSSPTRAHYSNIQTQRLHHSARLARTMRADDPAVLLTTHPIVKLSVISDP